MNLLNKHLNILALINKKLKKTPEQTVEKANNDPKKVDSEQSKQTEATTPKETKNQTSNADNQSSKNNTESKTKETSNDTLELFGIGSIETNEGFNYTLKSLGNYSKDKLYIDSKNNLYGFIVRDLKIKKPNIDNFKYNEVIVTYGQIKYPNFLKLNNKFIPVNFAGFQFTDSTNLIKFEFNCDESYIDPETNKSYSVDYIYNFNRYIYKF